MIPDDTYDAHIQAQQLADTVAATLPPGVLDHLVSAHLAGDDVNRVRHLRWARSLLRHHGYGEGAANTAVNQAWPLVEDIAGQVGRFAARLGRMPTAPDVDYQEDTDG